MSSGPVYSSVLLQPTAPSAVQAASAIPATGDDVNLALLWALLVISGGAAAVLYSKRKRE